MRLDYYVKAFIDYIQNGKVSVSSLCNHVSVVHSYGLLHMITNDIRKVYPQATKWKLYTF